MSNNKENDKIINYMKKQEEHMVEMRKMLLNAQNTSEMISDIQKSIENIEDNVSDNAVKVFGALNTETAIRVAPEAIKPRLEKLEKEVKDLTKWKTKLYAMTAVIGVIAPILISLLINWLSKK